MRPEIFWAWAILILLAAPIIARGIFVVLTRLTGRGADADEE